MWSGCYPLSRPLAFEIWAKIKDGVVRAASSACARRLVDSWPCPCRARRETSDERDPRAGAREEGMDARADARRVATIIFYYLRLVAYLVPRDGGVRGWCMARAVYVARDASQQDLLQD
eukprot:scaffold79811_cov34-Tisochrysis_lutea.AAC.1